MGRGRLRLWGSLHEDACRLSDTRLAGMRLGGNPHPPALRALHARLELEELPDGRGGLEVDLEPDRQREHVTVVDQQRHRLVESGGHDPPGRVAGRPLVVLLEEKAPAGNVAVALHLELEPEEVRLPAAEAELVVRDQRERSWRSTKCRMPPWR